MIKKWIFLIVLVILGVVLFLNPNFKTIAAGVSILLFGMITLEEGFKVFTKGPLKKLLRKATDNLFKSISLGAIVTAFIQSSSLVSVITISFISAGLITLAGGIGLIFGANIGTTATAWLVAGFGLKVDISVLAMPMLIFGIIFSFQNNNAFKGVGNILAGLGFFFLGIYFMKEGFDVYSDQIDLTAYAISGFRGVIVYALIGIFITTILQSSSASLALILTALSAGQIEYENALALAIGTNVGTTVTALIGSIGSNVSGKRLAMAHLIFNLITGIVSLCLISPLAQFVDYLSTIIHISDDDYTLKLALFHSIFNVLGVILMIPFIKKLESFLLKFVKDTAVKDIDEPKFLNKAVLEFPGTAISSLQNETKYLFENAIYEIVAHAVNFHRSEIESDSKTKKLIKKSKADFDIDVRDLYLHKVKTIYGKILEYATRAQTDLNLNDDQNKRVSEIKIANRKMVEIIRDVKELRRNIIKYSDDENQFIKEEYQNLRRLIVKAIRTINRFRLDENKEASYKALKKMRNLAKTSSKKRNKAINDLIRKHLITTDMASSLVNDNENVNDMIKKLIQVGELLYSERDSILEAQ
jgi:phosphate:Na+ symporter